MRPDLKQKLDALERGERWRKRLVLAAAATVIAAFAFFYTRPSQHLEDVQAVVVASERGVDHWGQTFYRLQARLADGRLVTIDPGMETRLLTQGTTIELAHFKGAMGRHIYRLKPAGSPKPAPQR